ncbi:MAG: hypothetical protein ACE141_17375 [Bryobacteraceae bacterium]
METLRLKTGIALLGCICAVCMSAHTILIMLDPVAMKLSHEWAASAARADWVITTLFWLGPLWLAFAAVALKGPADRWVSLAGGAVLTILNVWHFFICAVPLMKGGPYAEPTAHHVLLVGSSVVATALMAWCAWRWPKNEGI